MTYKNLIVEKKGHVGIVTIDHPQRRLDDEDGYRLTWTYINFYVANGAVVMPGFGDPHDAPARETLARLFPRRDVIQLHLRELSRLAGNIHCMTQQQPRTEARRARTREDRGRDIAAPR